MNLICDKDITLEHINVRIEIMNSAAGFVAEFNVHYTATFFCARCLDPSSGEYRGNLTLTYVPGKDPHRTAEKVDLKRSDLNKIYYTGPQIDVSIGIREAVTLSLPLVTLCADTCAGLCPVCGVNRNKTECQCEPVQTGIFSPIIEEEDPRRKKKKKGTNQ